MKKEKDGEMSGKLNSLENRRILDYVKAVRKKNHGKRKSNYMENLFPKLKLKSQKRYIREIKNGCIRFFFTRSSLHSVMNSV